MKKTGLFKILIFTLLGILVLSWLIPASSFESGELVEYGVTAKIGFFDFTNRFIQNSFLVFVNTVFGLIITTAGIIKFILKKSAVKKEED